MKAVITDRIYIKPTPEQATTIKATLTYKFEKYSKGNGAIKLFDRVLTYKSLPGGIISLPQGREDLIPEGYSIVDKRVTVPAEFPDPKFELFSEQQPIYNSVNSSCFINALPGWGKTFTALHIAKKLGQKTLIIVHTVALRDQWCAEIEKLFGIKPSVIGSSLFSTAGPIVVGNIQSLKKYVLKLSGMFGTVFVDEAHHCPATTFTEVLDASRAKYRIALSGTRTRKDGKHVLFNDYFGPVVFTPNVSNTIAPEIQIVKSNITLPVASTWSDRVTKLLNNDFYVGFISVLALKMLERGHQVLVIADRVDFLKEVSYYVGKSCVFVAGEVTYEERERAKNQLLSREKMCIAGSRQIFSEGISIDTLSCVILASPISNEASLEQIIGRVMRISDDKKLAPLVLDINLVGPESFRQAKLRRNFYMKKGWKILGS